jgi:hypothetical protein
MKIFEDALFQTKFNHVKHKVELYLDSGDGQSDNNIYPINPNSIVNLTIEDTLSDWVGRGHMTFFYNPESGTEQINQILGQNKSASTGLGDDLKPFYIFRNDGNDKLRIRVVPDLSDSNLEQNGLKISDPLHWTLSYLFSVYDIEDIGNMPGAQNASSATIKCLKIYFWDEWYQKMITNVIEYSTAKSNLDQKLETGTAMKEIVEKSLKNAYGFPLDSTDGVPIKESEWERGSSKIFFTAPAQSNAYECLMYVYDKHTSEQFLDGVVSGTSDSKAYDFSLLIKEKGPEETSIGQLTLKPVSDFFKKAGSSSPGPYQTEHFFLQGYSNNTQRAGKSLKSPISDNESDVIDFKSSKYGIITNYRFVDISPVINSEYFCTTPIYSFDFKNRKYNIEFQNNSVQTARKLIAQKYINELYKNNRGDIEKLFLITLDDDKKTNRNIKTTFSVFGDEEDYGLRQSSGLQKLLYAGLFQNACINFKTLGLSFREPGRFIAIDRTEGVDSSDFENKFYGQWFVINIKHVFESEIYYNEITAVKIHRFDQQEIKFPGTF